MRRFGRFEFVFVALFIFSCLVTGVIFTGGATKAVPEPKSYQEPSNYNLKPHESTNLSSANTVSQIYTGICSQYGSPTILVSISKQHLWACQDNNSAFDTPVTTGATELGNYTPTGSFSIDSKQTNRYLNGSDSQGAWHDFVYYWMPFYGAYGFHDATWQTMPFGDLAHYTTGGSHGCVRLPLVSMAWLYSWAQVGTTVVIRD